jgi:cytochrome c-type biogenesis protein CcmH/NrfF
MENWLRQQAGQAVYTASFVDRYVLPVLYPPALSRETQWLLGALVLGVNLGVYLVVLRRRVSGRRQANPPGGSNVLRSD